MIESSTRNSLHGDSARCSLKRDGKVYVYFVYAGEKTLKNAPLQLVSGAEAQHPLLDHRKSQGPRKGITRKTVPALSPDFLTFFRRASTTPNI